MPGVAGAVRSRARAADRSSIVSARARPPREQRFIDIIPRRLPDDGSRAWSAVTSRESNQGLVERVVWDLAWEDLNVNGIGERATEHSRISRASTSMMRPPPSRSWFGTHLDPTTGGWVSAS